MNRLRILHVIRSLDPEAGGPPLMCARLAEAQLALGHVVELGVQAFDPARSVLDPARHLPVRRFGVPGGGERLLSGKVAKAVEEVCRYQHVIHLHGVWDTLLVVAANAAIRAKVPHVVVPHGMLDPWSLGQKRWKKRVGLAVGSGRMLRTAAALHLVYADEAAHARALGVRVSMRAIPNGVSLAEIDPVPEASEFRRSVPELGADPFVLFLGRLHHKKGLDILAAAFARIAARFPTLRLVVAGPDQGAREPFERQIASVNLTGRVHLVGPLYGRQKYAALAAAACFCLPSRQEGFSVAVLEALACRTPVVLSDACHFPEVAEAGVGRVVPLTPDAVADALAAVVADPAARAMGDRGRALVEKQYTWERVAEQTIDLYHSVLPWVQR